MTQEESKEFLKAIQGFFPKLVLTNEAANLWISSFLDLDHETAFIALRQLSRAFKWIPSIADIRGTYAQLLLPEIVDDEQAWGLVINAIEKHGGIHSQEAAMNELPKQVQEAVKWVGGIKAISMCPNENMDYLRGQFTKAMSTVNERVRKELSLGPKLSNQIDNMKLAMKEQEEVLRLENKEVVPQITYGPVTDDKKIDYNIKQCGILREVYARAQKGRVENE